MIGISQCAMGEKKDLGGLKYGLWAWPWNNISGMKMFTNREKNFLVRFFKRKDVKYVRLRESYERFNY